MDIRGTILLILAGGLGGLAQALLAEKGRVKVPTWDASAREVDFGFFADVLIGMIGALASLVVGLAVLNQQFFAEAGSVATGSNGGSFFDVPTWIRLLSFGALTGFGSRRLLPALSDKVTSAISGEVSKQVESSEKRLMQQNEAAAEVLDARITGVTAGAEMKLAAVAAPPVADLVKEYDAINEADFIKRLALKNQIASRMGALLLHMGDQRANILPRIGPGKSEAWVLALAVQIVASPKIGDGALLAGVSRDIQKLHVRYRVVSAFYSLKLKRLLSSEETKAAVDLIKSYASGADASLRRNIESTLAYLQSEG
jgi:hypothetical protein